MKTRSALWVATLCCTLAVLLMAGALFGQDNLLAKQAAEVQQGKKTIPALLASYQQRIAREPNNPEPYALAAAVADRDESRGLYEKALAVSPNYIPARVGLARYCLRKWDWATAFNHFEKALVLLPNDRSLRLEAIRAAARSSHMAEARTMAGDDPEFKAEIIQAFLDKATTEKKKPDASVLKLFTELGLDSSKEAVVLGAKGRLLTMGGGTQEQRQQGLDLLIESWKKAPELMLHYKAAYPREATYQMLLKSVRRTDGLAMLSAGIQKFPTEYALYEPLWKTSFTQAKADYSADRAAVQAKVEELLKYPPSPDQLKTAALGYEMADDLASVNKIHQRLLAEFPYSSAAQSVRRQQIAKCKDLREKVNLYVRFNEDFPYPQAPYTEYFATLNELNPPPEELLKGAELFINNYPYKYLAVNDIGQVFVERGIYLDRLQKWLDEVSRSRASENNGGTLDGWGARLLAIRGKLMLLQGHPAEAEKLLLRTINIKTQGYGAVDNGRAKYYMGDVLLALGRKDEALDMYAQGYAESQHYSAQSGVKFRKLWVEMHGSEKGMDEYLGKREDMLLASGEGGLEIGTKIEMPAPDFNLLSLLGSRVSMASLKGKVVILNFWATW